jgi:hypothetical protein
MSSAIRVRREPACSRHRECSLYGAFVFWRSVVWGLRSAAGRVWRHLRAARGARSASTQAVEWRSSLEAPQRAKCGARLRG